MVSLIMLVIIGMSSDLYGFKERRNKQTHVNMSASNINTRAPRPDAQSSQIVQCCSGCGDIGQLLCEIRNDIDMCCSEILSNFCGAPTHISQTDIPFTITTPGRYCIVEDLITSDTAITVFARGVVIDCNNHTINLLGPLATGIAIESSEDVMIYGGSMLAINILGGRNRAPVSGLLGIAVENSSTVDIYNMSFENMVTGILTNTAQGVIVDTCSFSGNNIAIEFCPENSAPQEQEQLETTLSTICTECIATNCIIVDYSYKGISVTQTSNFYLEDLVLRGTTGATAGITTNLSVHGQIVNARVEGPGMIGIEALSSQAVQVVDCLVFLEEDDAYGISIKAGLNVFYDQDEAEVEVDLAEDCVVANCLISGSYDQGLHLEGLKKGVVQNCQIMGDGNIGVEVFHALDVWLQNCAITMGFGIRGLEVSSSSNVQVTDCVLGLEAPTAHADAMGIINTSNITIKDSVFNLNTAPDDMPGGDGIVLEGGCRNCLIQNCSILNQPESGILVLNPASFGPNFDLVIDNCVIQDSFQDAIYFEGVSAGSINNCEIAFADFNGINLIGCSQILVLDNNIRSNDQNGLVLDADTINCAVRDNTISGNLLGGLINNGGASNAIYHNFANNNGTGPTDNYTGVSFVVPPGPGIGVIENISQ